MAPRRSSKRKSSRRMSPNAGLSFQRFESLVRSFDEQAENLDGMLGDMSASRQDVFDQYVRLVSIFGNVQGALAMDGTPADKNPSAIDFMRSELRRLAPRVSARLGL